jgi:hypothetical protein
MKTVILILSFLCFFTSPTFSLEKESTITSPIQDQENSKGSKQGASDQQNLNNKSAPTSSSSDPLQEEKKNATPTPTPTKNLGDIYVGYQFAISLGLDALNHSNSQRGFQNQKLMFSAGNMEWEFILTPYLSLISDTGFRIITLTRKYQDSIIVGRDFSQVVLSTTLAPRFFFSSFFFQTGLNMLVYFAPQSLNLTNSLNDSKIGASFFYQIGGGFTKSIKNGAVSFTVGIFAYIPFGAAIINSKDSIVNSRVKGVPYFFTLSFSTVFRI